MIKGVQRRAKISAASETGQNWPYASTEAQPTVCAEAAVAKCYLSFQPIPATLYL